MASFPVPVEHNIVRNVQSLRTYVTELAQSNTPIDVPIHWRDDVKAGLDQDGKMGVIEAVPVGTPVTWCHRMVCVQRRTGNQNQNQNQNNLFGHISDPGDLC